ncbi:MAG: hypothetical protein AAGJ87_04910 [Pseudomonadota bacterium]
MLTTRSLIRTLACILGSGLVGVWDTAVASAWGRRGGDLFVLTRTDYFRARGDFLASSPGDDTDLFQRLEANFYAEYGVTDAFTVGGKLIYGVSRASNAVETVDAAGVTVAEAFAQHQLWKGDYDVGAARIGVILPASFDSGVRQELAADGVDTEFRFLYGRSLAQTPFPVYANVETAFRRRFGDAADQAIADITLGAEPIDGVLLLLQSFNTVSARNNEDGGADFDVYRIQPSIVFRHNRRWAIEAGFIHEFAGRNFDRGNTAFIGVWSNF